jgi:hypothetical protein
MRGTWGTIAPVAMSHWVKLRSQGVQPRSRLCLQERTSSAKAFRSQKCHRQTLVHLCDARL